MLSTLEVGTVVIVGMMVGVEFSVAFVMNRIFSALPDDSNQAARSHGGRMLGAVMPFWYFGSLLLTAIWAVAGWGSGTGLVVAGAALLIVSVVMSVLLLVPINNQGKKWTAQTRPADWKEQMSRWDRYHYARVAVIVAAFVCLAAALV
ncbi:DUF1772 domain-containing protein [Amycolatopsis benzoatilytica]|uniref:DUF1772 domain-containing protein n=1 Tax=Amycolatopsis benzoatilytica TaxID=346045 RepID=UPI000368EB87|nr:DUF1772 domain-containing protein [Amycolatopsis benzoatilytica]